MTCFVFTWLNKKCRPKYFLNIHFDFACKTTFSCCCELNANVKLCTCQSVVVKGLERNISCLYEARRLLLGLDSCEIAKVIEVTPDPSLAGSGLTNYWLNMLLQQLRLSEQGEDLHTRTHTHVSVWLYFHPNVMGLGKILLYVCDSGKRHCGWQHLLPCYTVMMGLKHTHCTKTYLHYATRKSYSMRNIWNMLRSH